MMSQLPKIKKPTVGFLARFILEPSRIRKRLPDNDLQMKKTPKREKVQSKMLFFHAQPPVFLPKRLKKALFLLSVRFLSEGLTLLSLDGE